MSIASLVVAIMYLLLILVGAVGALLLVVWLFGETPGEARTSSHPTRSARNANFSEGSTPPTPTGIERSEDRAA